MILLPLRPASLKHNNSPKTQKFFTANNNSRHASHTTQRTISQFEDILVEYPVRVISVAVV